MFLVAMLNPNIQKHCNTCCLLAEQASEIYLLYVQSNSLCSLDRKDCQTLNVTVKCNMSKDTSNVSTLPSVPTSIQPQLMIYQ